MSAGNDSFEVAIIGAGVVGLSVAYYLSKRYGCSRIVLIDPRDPMSLTSAQSGENYRNWWPHPVMTDFTNDSINLMEEIASATGNRIAMLRRGYTLITRDTNPTELIRDLYRGYGAKAGESIRIHEGAGAHSSYRPPLSAKWEDAPEGVDVLRHTSLIQNAFPTYAPDVSTVVHVRRAGSISGQQLGQFMLEYVRENRGQLIRGELREISKVAPLSLVVATEGGSKIITADKVVNAAGPFLRDVAAMTCETLNASCIYQQKIAFEDRERVVPRDLPFTIDLDGQKLPWTEEEREILTGDPITAGLTEFMQGGIHCRPDGGENGKWIKLGWAFNKKPTDPHGPEPIDGQFPDIVLRAASRLQPGLAKYVGKLPRGAHHYGGYYTATPENWPLIGPMQTPGVFVAGALSGFGTMAACITGSLCADWIAGKPVASYAQMLAPSRYQDPALMAELQSQQSRGHL
ncbi:FAD-dependent oxidoreductase [Ensifer sp. Root127]|nr:FAD-binding oxidoreductase [Ensifer sp. Root127]KQW72418.1 FAD-dependent oxidoreductase [Ensifer sp. Root127]